MLKPSEFRLRDSDAASRSRRDDDDPANTGSTLNKGSGAKDAKNLPERLEKIVEDGGGDQTNSDDGKSLDEITKESIDETGDENLTGGAGNETLSLEEVGDIIGELEATLADLEALDADADALFDLTDFIGVLNEETGSTSTTTQPTSNVSTIASNGDDVLIGTPANDSIDGLAGNDTVFGLADDDHLLGGDGDDTLSGSGGNDTLYGGNGSDRLNGGSGNDTLNGGAGFDTAVYSAGGNVIANLTTNVVLDGVGGVDNLTSIEALELGAGDDIVEVGGQNVTVDAGSGDDDIELTAAPSTSLNLDGGAGFDELVIGDAITNLDLTSTLAGGTVLTNFDVLNLQDATAAQSATLSAADVVDVTDGANTLIVTGGANDVLQINGNWSFSNLTPVGNGTFATFSNGTATISFDTNITTNFDGLIFSSSPTPGEDTLTGTGADDVIDALAGNDSISGLGGNDTLIGGDGNDDVEGGDGDDTVTGGNGDDLLDGGNGTDTAIFSSGGNVTANLTSGNVTDGNGRVRSAV